MMGLSYGFREGFNGFAMQKLKFLRSLRPPGIAGAFLQRKCSPLELGQWAFQGKWGVKTVPQIGRLESTCR